MMQPPLASLITPRTRATKSRWRSALSLGILLCLAGSAIAQGRLSAERREALLQQERELAQVRDDARFEADLARLPPEEAAKLRRLVAAGKLAYRSVNGKQNPELVPYHMRMQGFFAEYADGTFRRQLNKALSASDLLVLDDFATRYQDEAKRFGREHLQNSMSVYARAASMSAIEIAHALKAESDRVESAQADMYKSAIGQLSVEGQEVVNRFAFENVRPMTSLWDPVPEAMAEPELYKEQAMQTYEAYRRGEWPGLQP